MPSLPNQKPSGEVPLAVWPVTQITSQYQRAGRYDASSSKHPGKMVPALARRIVEEYSSPGDLVVDPMCGIGTTIVEGASLARRCIGIDLEQRWIEIAHSNIAAAVTGSHHRFAEVRPGDASRLSESLGSLSGSVDLIATSPPYACDVATVDKRAWHSGGSLKSAESYNYSDDTANLGHARGDDYRQQMIGVYRSCFDALRPGGLLVTVTKNMRRKGRLIDLVSLTVELATSVGFGYFQHNIALLCGVQNDGLVARPSFWQTHHLRAARARGVPQHLVAHEDVLVFVKDSEVTDV